ncbi:hypothetical protein ABK01_08815 [Treponema sp. OMZ 305]|uniref:hypothetical protein n=1 Tax=Treponema sp. OMZ 305 TaxID=1659192 RepID=UPI0020A24CA7|nr:hypothetical protein [Treponema sp. OMZ 305]UTC58354.1 hypothetical protein ABK01_08815 [Treponema sp. OMZ 305]
MKKSIYPPCLILFVLLLVPVTACTTKAAAEKPQDTPSRQEQPAAKGASHTGDMMSPQSAPTETQPSKSATQPDAVSGATIDTVSGATVSQRQKKTPASEAVGADKDMATGGAAVSQKQHTTAASPALAAADMSVPAKIAGEAEPTTAAAENIAAPAAADTAAEQIPTAPSTGEPVPLVAADTSATSAKQNVPAYETTLADLISDFEKQGGSHGYEPPPTFHEEMLDLFSPQIFTVALSKEPETEQKPKVSRMVAVEEKQRLELTYPGHGWVYVGEQTSQPGLKYEQRKLQDENSIFMFTAEKKGDYVLHFSYFDVFTNEFITDAVAVSVSAARSPAAKAMVKAPDYQTEADSDAAEAQAKKNTQSAASQSASNSTSNTGSGTTPHTAQAAPEAPQTAGAGSQSKISEQAMTAEMVETAAAENTGDSTGQASTAASEEILSSDQLLEKARTAIAAADAGTALAYLNNFFGTAEEKLDEGLFLKGRAYELNSSVRNIRLALAAYKTLTDSFPQSKYWAEADARIRYITGFYINIQ